MVENVLEMHSIAKSFGQTQALNGINFELKSGEIHALLGENGAGKSTLIKVLGGIHQPDRGEISINGNTVQIKGVHDAQAHGIGVIHQEIVLVPYLTVAENIFLGREPVTKLGLIDRKQMNAEAQEMVKELGLNLDVNTLVGELSVAHQQLVEIVKAISFNIKILVMDEPTSSLSDEEVKHLFVTMERLRQNGVSMIYISHKFEELFTITDRITIIRDGTYVGTVITKNSSPDELVAMMVGRELKNFYTRTYSRQDEVVLKVDHLSKQNVFEDISFSVHKGEILGFSGLMGAGRSELMLAIFGAYGYDNGSVSLNGEELKIKSCSDAIEKGIALVPEDRKDQGLVLMNSVGFNMTLSELKHLMKNKLIVSEEKRSALISTYIKSLNIKTASPDAEVSSLSGGNQQKVVLAKWLATNPKLLILDEPTRGVDVGAKSEIYSIINELAKQGLAIILVSSELPEIINMCDSVCVMREGKLTAQLAQSELSQENIMRFATGG
ncbi:MULTISPECIES: sugar ABC transporter ATP-binding protein [unclassified Paenibacillus]|uniref:sugar ABC transporter ATP-binding protein n=1 Tax=unclassified Paenibacillus TaxID=185978 RepID=UPI0024054B16|nr:MULTISPECIES: sugar ABC transporter ATP-binding protein [unclassified Paenibacillus]MDF9844950.1 ABC-type sugar transport system ATPase subunit [Paenibacillus sp. PastF-2]MDF9851518.1 ABC-type sugar transport system ATPase subunit [Paenibacillus sp. PastM-2]MDF9858102.1 ABC-type sugar transport system ATPase subunit [Paenibacillus sp. PastF-1]MDH6483413.1 ABC-type sugar transport system ATPase subunit [Paenibacillus sp. PastH-2]MDH6510778.1 ABC-type sugar transport system ATPase subunit [Pa